jgi:hypothetical protein
MIQQAAGQDVDSSEFSVWYKVLGAIVAIFWCLTHDLVSESLHGAKDARQFLTLMDSPNRPPAER